MYYLCANIIKPLTQPYQLSFAEFVGPSCVCWFVSHFWGHCFRQFCESLHKHAETFGASSTWKEQSYWICTFSNNQWEVAEELGKGSWERSSFFLALHSGECAGTAMVLDERALPLRRAWCLFEVLQTLLLLKEHGGDFHGLQLCTLNGVLNEGQGGADMAVAVAEQLSTLCLRSAEASCEDDKVMIHRLVEGMPGGFDAVNGFVRAAIRGAVLRMQERFQEQCRGIVDVLDGQVPEDFGALQGQGLGRHANACGSNGDTTSDSDESLLEGTSSEDS